MNLEKGSNTETGSV